ncbi:MAG: MBL fold metallo-hydrolase, partial [Clostridia bacterium]|nr:MBL fold metallo-hydrolase [Clostridia bacterium]
SLSADMPLAMINAADWPAWLIALYAAAAFCASPYVRFNRTGWRRAAAFSALAAVIALGLALPRFASRQGLAITFVDVGQGDGAVMRAEGHVYLVDTGGGSDMAEYLLNQGLEPEGIFLSHGHSDHVAGLDSILDVFPPCPIYVSSQWSEDPMDEAVAAIWQRALAAGWPVVTLSAGDELMLSDAVALRVWHPGAVPAKGTNENSMVLSVRYGESAALFTGDLPMAQELMLLPDCTVLKVGHHGSKYSTSQVLLDQVTPAVAVISVGHNSFGHPTQEVLDRLRDTAVFRTDERGAITVVMEEDGTTRVTAWLPEVSS